MHKIIFAQTSLRVLLFALAAKGAHKSTISASTTDTRHPISSDVSEIILDTLIIKDAS